MDYLVGLVAYIFMGCFVCFLSMPLSFMMVIKLKAYWAMVGNVLLVVLVWPVIFACWVLVGLIYFLDMFYERDANVDLMSKEEGDKSE